jgi:threonine aldolase
MIEKLSENYLFETWARIDDNNTAIRLVTSWATDKNEVLAFVKDLKNVL